MRRRLFLAVIPALVFAGYTYAADLYKEISPAVPTSVEAGQIEVVEVFSYGCGHCYNLEPYIETWDKTKPANVKLIRIPIGGSGFSGFYAQVYYTLEVMGAVDKGHKAFFDGIFIDRLKIRSKEEAANYLAKYGVDKDEFMKNWESFAVRAKITRGEDLVNNKYKIDYTPAVFVQGRYLVSGSTVNGGVDKIFPVVDQLIKDLKP